jgi:hypothetical protein
MKVIAKVTMFKNKGSAYEKEIFTKGKEYEYCAESSTWQNKLVEPNDGTGQYSIFNEEDFIKYFSLK